MPFKIKNWKLALLALVFIAVFTRLGIWQLSRASEKKLLLKSYAERTQHAPLSAADTHNQNSDLRFYRVKLDGHFDNEHTLLLDNKISHGKIGYEIYTPFIADGIAQPILVDRGFIAIMHSRKELPQIPTIKGKITITGIFNVPPKYVSLGQMSDSPTNTWPLRIEYVNLSELAHFLNHSLYPYLLLIHPSHPAAHDMQWQVVMMSPEKHMGYAVQWFALALTLLILFTALNRR